MTLHVRIDTMKDAERLSHILRTYRDEIYLRSDKLCVDPKSVLGILALMYSARGAMVLDTGDMPDETVAHLILDLNEYLTPEDRKEKAS